MTVYCVLCLCQNLLLHVFYLICRCLLFQHPFSPGIYWLLSQYWRVRESVCVCVCVCLCVHVNCHWMVGVFIRCAVFYCHLERQLPYNVHRVCTRNQISHAGTLSFFKWLCAWARLDITVLQEHNIIRNVMATLKMAWQTFLPDTKEILPVSIELSNFKIWTKTSFSSFSFVVKGTFLCSSTHFYPKTDYRWLQIKLKWAFNAWHSSNQWLW